MTAFDFFQQKISLNDISNFQAVFLSNVKIRASN